MVQQRLTSINVVLLGAVLLVAATILAVQFAATPATVAFLDNIHWTIATVAAALMAWLGYRGAAPEPGDRAAAGDRQARYWFAWGLTAYAGGQLLWDLQAYFNLRSFPAPSDALYLLLGPCCAVGFFASLTARVRRADCGIFILDAAAFAVAILALMLALYLQRNPVTAPVPLGVLIAYPTSLFGAVCCGFVLALTLVPRISFSWLLLLAGLTVSGLLWMLWNVLTIADMVGSGKGMNAMFSLAALMSGFGAARWRLMPTQNPAHRRFAESVRYILPMTLVLLACAAIVLGNAFSGLPRVMQIIIDGAAIIVAVLAIIRQSLLLKERDQLLTAENRARRLEERMRAFFSVSDDPIFVVRVEPDRFVYEELNPAALAIVKKSPAEFREFTPYDVMPKELADRIYALYRQCAAGGQPMRYEYPFDSPSGRHWFDTRLLPVRNSDGVVTHLHGISRSVTELKKQTEKLEGLASDLDRARREAESANRAKSMFLAKMSHELRTPLNAIIGFTEVMDRQVFGPIGNDRYADYLKDIHASGHMLLLLVNDVLDLSKLEAGQYQLQEESVDLGEIAAETCAMLEQQAQSKGITLFNIRRPLPRVKADRRAISQILVNLVANSLKFTPPAGSIEIITDRGPDGAPRLTVRDTGIGIPQSEIDSVREAFVQGSGATRSAEPGTGLGLAIVCSMAELHGGTVSIESEVGKGTSVAIRLPAIRLLAA